MGFADLRPAAPKCPFDQRTEYPLFRRLHLWDRRRRHHNLTARSSTLEPDTLLPPLLYQSRLSNPYSAGDARPALLWQIGGSFPALFLDFAYRHIWCSYPCLSQNSQRAYRPCRFRHHHQISCQLATADWTESCSRLVACLCPLALYLYLFLRNLQFLYQQRHEPPPFALQFWRPDYRLYHPLYYSTDHRTAGFPILSAQSQALRLARRY